MSAATAAVGALAENGFDPRADLLARLFEDALLLRPDPGRAVPEFTRATADAVLRGAGA